ncbi:MAG: lipoyl(octanoyl) transferase LipB [Gammaproteobacteria bacterium]
MQTLVLKQYDLCDYADTWRAMQSFTEQRQVDTPDEVWLLQHPPVFTQGLAGKPEHVLNPGSIPIIQTDRGGQVTYHGPGQLVAYTLFDLKRLKIGIRQLVRNLEQVVINLLDHYHISAASRCDAPGVYVKEAKICSLGLRVRKGCSYHGIALNVDMDLAPFSRINPCGWQNLAMTQIRDWVPQPISLREVQVQLVHHLQQLFEYEITP